MRLREVKKKQISPNQNEIKRGLNGFVKVVIYFYISNITIFSHIHIITVQYI